MENKSRQCYEVTKEITSQDECILTVKKIPEFHNIDSEIYYDLNIIKEKLFHKITFKTASDTVSNTSIPSRESFKHLKNSGLDSVLCIMVNIENLKSTKLTMTDYNNINKAINNANSENVEITMLKPHLGINYQDSTNRAFYDPENYEDFFYNWKEILLNCAEICRLNKIPMLCIGCEQYNTTRLIYKDKWKDIYNSIKKEYSELILVYACCDAEWYRDIENAIFENVDYIGLNVYLQWYPYDYDESLTWKDIAPSLYHSFGLFNRQDGCMLIDKANYLSERYNKKIFITEIGVMPYSDGLKYLLSNQYPDKSQENFKVTALVYEAIMNILPKHENIIGLSFWSVGEPFNFYNDSDISVEKLIRKYVDGGEF